MPVTFEQSKEVGYFGETEVPLIKLLYMTKITMHYFFLKTSILGLIALKTDQCPALNLRVAGPN